MYSSYIIVNQKVLSIVLKIKPINYGMQAKTIITFI